MSLDNNVASIHPVFLSQLTQSKRQRQHRSLSHDEHTVYALCVLLFPQCYVPLHLPLTDLILCHGGTTELVTVLNRFGAVASADTHSRFLQDLSADRKAILPKMHSALFLWITLTFCSHMYKYMPQIPTEATMGPPFSVLNQCPQPVMNEHHCVINIEKRVHSLTPSRFPSALMERPKRMRILPTAWIEQPLCISDDSA